MSLVKVLTAGPVVNVPVSEFKPDTLGALLTGNTEAIITKNKETLGVYMTVEHRNNLANEIELAYLAADLALAGKTWDDVQRSSDQVASGQAISIEEAIALAKAGNLAPVSPASLRASATVRTKQPTVKRVPSSSARSK